MRFIFVTLALLACCGFGEEERPGRSTAIHCKGYSSSDITTWTWQCIGPIYSMYGYTKESFCKANEHQWERYGTSGGEESWCSEFCCNDTSHWHEWYSYCQTAKPLGNTLIPSSVYCRNKSYGFKEPCCFTCGVKSCGRQVEM